MQLEQIHGQIIVFIVTYKKLTTDTCPVLEHYTNVGSKSLSMDVFFFLIMCIFMASLQSILMLPSSTVNDLEKYSEINQE